MITSLNCEREISDDATIATYPKTAEIFTDAPVIDEVEDVNQESERVKANYDNYYAVAQKYKTIMPNLKGMSAMDAISILENMGLKVRTQGNGTVSKQSVISGQKVKPQSVITLVLS